MGTLVELVDPAPALARELRERHGIEVSAAAARAALAAEITYYRAHHDEGRDEASLHRLRLACAGVLRGALPAAAQRLSAAAALDALMAALRFRAFADAAPALGALREAGLRLAVVSNWDVSLSGVLSAAELRFDAVITSATVGAAKPAPAIFAAALSRLGVEAAQAVHVGDSLEHDVAGARASGVRAILLCRTGAVPDGVEVEAITSLAQLPERVRDPSMP